MRRMRSALSSQHWLHSLIVSITSLILCYSATGGELIQTLLLAVPLAIVFVISGYVVGLLALCGSLAAVTGLFALLNLVSQQVPIPQPMTYIAVSVGAIAITTGLRHSTGDMISAETSNRAPFALVPLLVALASGYQVLQWTTFTDLEFLNALAGSEDNAAWISITRTFLAGEMTTDFVAHPTAMSPVTASTLGFISDVYGIAQADTSDHLLALRALRGAYALIIMLSSVGASVWISVVAIRVKASVWLGYVASLVVATAVLGSSIFLFLGVGFFSFMNAIMFAICAIIGFEVAYSQTAVKGQLHQVLILVLAGFAGAWWGVAPLAVVLVVVVITTPGGIKRWGEWSRGEQLQSLGLWLLSVVTILWTWDISIGSEIEVGYIGLTGTVPLVEMSWFAIILLVVAALVMQVTDHPSDWRRRVFHLLLALYVVAIWLLSMLNYAEPRYAAFKILVLLSFLMMVGLGVVLVERVSILGKQTVLAGLALVLLWSSVVHESHNGIRGPGRSSTDTTFQSRILETLDLTPDAKVVCLHQNPELRIQAYLCSRLAASFSPGRSEALNEWVGAILNSDSSPNGVEISRENHVGTQVLIRFQEELAEQDVVVILIGGNRAEGVLKDLGPDFWWVQELNWAEIRAVYL